MTYTTYLYPLDGHIASSFLFMHDASYYIRRRWCSDVGDHNLNRGRECTFERIQVAKVAPPHNEAFFSAGCRWEAAGPFSAR